MGNRLTEEEPKQTSATPYGDIFDTVFPDYIVMGMTPELFWDGEASNYPAYRKAYRERIDTQQKMADWQNWIMGQYLMAVLQAVPLLVGGLNVPKGARLPEYPDKPYLEKAEEEKRETDRRKREEDQMKLAMAMFQSFTMKVNKQIESSPKSVSSGQ